jgi:hypothetical protein
MKDFLLILSLAVIAAVLYCGCGKKEATPTADQTQTKTGTNAASSGNPITAPVDYVGAVGQAKKHAEKVVDTVSLNQAIQLFYAQEDRFPKDLQELVTTRYLPSIPPAPYGMKYDYDAKLGQVKVVRDVK